MSKAKVLQDLTDRLSLFIIPPLIKFDLGSWIEDSTEIIHQIQSKFAKSELIAVRSSAFDEDGVDSAKAGQYESILNVPSNDKNKIRAAIDTVYSSYDTSEKQFKENEIFCQKMVDDVLSSGVIFTHELNRGSPYYVINYDDVSELLILSLE